MTQEIKLSIFDPLNEYFQILCIKCNYKKEYINNQDLINLLTNKCDKDNKDNDNKDNNNNISKHFLDALEQFAKNLKVVTYRRIEKIEAGNRLFSCEYR